MKGLIWKQWTEDENGMYKRHLISPFLTDDIYKQKSTIKLEKGNKSLPKIPTKKVVACCGPLMLKQGRQRQCQIYLKTWLGLRVREAPFDE